MALLVRFLRAAVERKAGFRVDVSCSEVLSPDQFDLGNVLCLRSGKHTTIAKMDGFSDSAHFVIRGPVEDLLNRAVIDLQMQVHGYNDFQRAIGVMAAEA